jgi:DNA-binding FadR family transcriptional regulator
LFSEQLADSRIATHNVDTDVQSQPNFSPIKTKRAFEAVCDHIRSEVALASCVPAIVCPERDFAEQLGVSRTATREAIQTRKRRARPMLPRLGRGAFIRKRDSAVVPQAVADMIMLGQIPSRSVTEMWIILTEQAIRLVCERATEDDFF